MIAIALAAAVVAQPTGTHLPPVPHTSSSVLLDARCEETEWRQASRTRIAGGTELLLQQDAAFLYLCVPLPPDSYGTMDLYVQSPASAMPFNLHASADVGERQRTATGWPEWTFGNQRDWYSPPVPLRRAEVANNRPRLVFGAIEAREVAIRKSKFGDGPWRLMLELRALGPAKDGRLRYPASAAVDAPATWAVAPLAPPIRGH